MAWTKITFWQYRRGGLRYASDAGGEIDGLFDRFTAPFDWRARSVESASRFLLAQAAPARLG